MIDHLALLQLPLLYMTTLVMGLALYGSDFDRASGRVVLVLIVALPLLALLAQRSARRLADPRVLTALGLAGIGAAALAYRGLHMDYWDEQSTALALRLAALGVLSVLLSAAGGARLRQRALDEPGRGAARGRAAALVAIGAAWLGAGLYPFVPLLAIGVVFALAACDRPHTPAGPARGPTPDAEPLRPLRFGILRFGIVLVALDLSLVVFDCGVSLDWAPHLALAFAAAAAAASAPRAWRLAILGLGSASFVLAALAPVYVLFYAHSAIAGAALGVLLARALEVGCARADGLVLAGASAAWTFGLALSVVFSLNLEFAVWRVVLLAGVALAARPSRARAPDVLQPDAETDAELDAETDIRPDAEPVCP